MATPPSLPIADALAKATRRRQPLVVVLLPSDGAARATAAESLQLGALAPLGVFHVIVEGSDDFNNFAAANPQGSGAAELPRCHIFAPRPRGIPSLQLSGSSLTKVALRNAIMQAGALTAAEAAAIGDNLSSLQAQLHSTPNGPTAPPAKGAVSASPSTKPADAAKQPEAVKAPAPAASAAPAAPAPAPSSGLEVRVLGDETQTIHVSGARDNTALPFLRKLIGKVLGHTNFTMLSATGAPMNSSEEERRIVGDIRAADGLPVIHITAAQQAIDAAKREAATAHAHAEDSAAVAESASEPAQQRGPRSEPTGPRHVTFTMRRRGGAGEVTLSGAVTQSLASLWGTACEHLGCAEDKLRVEVRAEDSDSPTIVDKASASHVTLETLEKAAAITAYEVSPPAEVQPVAASKHVDPAASVGEGGADVVRVRLAYPGVKDQPTVVCEPSDPLRVVFERAAADLQTRDISLVQAYPPRRFKESELDETLAALNIKGSAVLRVVADPTASTASATDGGAAASRLPGVGAVTSLLGGALSGSARLVGGLFGRGQQPQPPQAAAAANAHTGPARNLGELRRREAEEQERQRGPGGTNTYFGGDSTEYQGK